MLGVAWDLNHSDTPFSLPAPGPCRTHPRGLGSSLLALLSSCRARLLDFLGLKQGRTAAFLLHSSAALFAARAAATSSRLWALRRHNLRTVQRLQPLGLSSGFGSRLFFCILACALATGWSCTALAQLKPAVAICLARIKWQGTNPCPTDEQRWH